MAIPQRIVSLTPSGTEILCALGMESRLIGVSHACDYPSGVLSVPRFAPDDARLSLLQPDLVLTSSPQILPGSVDTEVLTLQPTLLQDIWDDIHRVGLATGQRRQATTLLDALFARVNAIVAETIRLPAALRVAVLVGTTPLRLAGYWLPDIIQLAGGAAGLSRPGAPPLVIAWEQLQAHAPEVLVLSHCGAPLVDMRAELDTLQRLPGWDALPAVRQGWVYAIEGRSHFHRPGPRIVESLELLAGLIHPDLFGEYLQREGELYCRLAL